MKYHYLMQRLIILLLGITLNSCTFSARSTPMDKTGWITHCFGRFLIDLPPNAEVHAGYYLWGEAIEKLNEDTSNIQARINSTIEDIKSKRNTINNQSMLIKSVELGGKSRAIISWSETFNTEIYLMDSYFFTDTESKTYNWKTEIASEKEKVAINISKSLAHNLRSRAPNEIPTEPGFCIEGAYIAGDKFQGERFNAGITFPNHPGAFFSFSTSTGAAQDRLLDRVSGFLSGAAKLVAGIETLRKGERNGAIVGEEYLIAGSDKGQRVYAFIWDFQGKNHSVTEPHIRADLEVGEAQKDEDDNLPPPPFKSDQEALQLWDTIIDSIRLRPTSSPRDDKVSLPPNSPYSADDYALHDFISGLSPKDDDWMNKL